MDLVAHWQKDAERPYSTYNKAFNILHYIMEVIEVYLAIWK